MITDEEKWSEESQWIRTGFLHGKDYDKMHPVVYGYNLSDENLIQILKFLEKYRNNNDLNSGMEAIKSQNKQNYWIAYFSLNKQETEEYDNYEYSKAVSSFVKTKVLKAKILGKWDECCEDIKQHKINEDKIFVQFINDCNELSESEKKQILS